MARRREAREQASPQIDVLREEMRASKEQTAQVLKLMQEQAEREEKARAEATVAALIQVNANLIQLCARIADNARLNEAQMLLSLLPLLNKEEKAGDPKVASQLQRLVDALRKDSEKRTDVKHPA
jgi:DNA-binding GntR family transcriptional regulator